MKLGILTTAILLSATMGVSAQSVPFPITQPSPTAQPSPSTQPPQPDYSYLNTQLQEAYCIKDWGKAIKVVDKMMEVVSKQPNSSKYMLVLVTYRGRLQGLLNSTSIVPAASLSGCNAEGGVATPNNTTPK